MTHYRYKSYGRNEEVASLYKNVCGWKRYFHAWAAQAGKDVFTGSAG